MSNAINQHWVPRFYLKHFSTEESRNKEESKVWIFSKIEGDPKLVNIKNIAAKRYLYSPKDEAGNRCWKMEKQFASLEYQLSQIWTIFANDFINLDNQAFRKIISLFLATLFLRHPKRLPEQEKMQNDLIDFYEKNIPKDKDGNLLSCQVITSKEEFTLDTSGWNSYSNPTKYDKEKFFIDTIRKSSMELVEVLMKKRWSVIYSETKQFITTNDPLVITNHQGEITNCGLNAKGTTITFPISPTRILVLDDLFDEPHSQYYPLRQDNGVKINILLWKNAHQFMISHRNSDEVMYEMVNYHDK